MEYHCCACGRRVTEDEDCLTRFVMVFDEYDEYGEFLYLAPIILCSFCMHK